MLPEGYVSPSSCDDLDLVADVRRGGLRERRQVGARRVGFVDRAVRTRAVADGHAAVTTGGDPVLPVQNGFPLLCFCAEPSLKAEPPLVLFVVRRGRCARSVAQ